MDELEAVMRNHQGSVGIAAPQLGEGLRALVVDCSTSRYPCRNHGLLRMINPEIVSSDSREILGREGCLSVPDWIGLVPRFSRIQVSFQDPEGERHCLKASGFEARVIQHEVDHLQGILFVDRMLSTHDLVRRMDGVS
jgi:peptide deformylase